MMPLNLKTGLKRKTPLKPSQLRPRSVDEDKASARWREQYHSEEYLAWIKGFPCLLCGGRAHHAHHFKTRGARGTWKDQGPVCATCHAGLHTEGCKSFPKRHNRTHEGLLDDVAALAKRGALLFGEDVSDPRHPAYTGQDQWIHTNIVNAGHDPDCSCSWCSEDRERRARDLREDAAL